MVYPENAIFPDCRLTAEMLALHESARAEATFGDEFSPGFLPEILEAELLPLLAKLRLGPAQTADLHRTLERVNRRNPAKPEFRIARLERTRLTERELERLASSLLVFNGNTRRAAEAVLTEGPPAPDSTPAFRFSELVRGYERRAVLPPLPCEQTPHGSRRVLFCSLATMFGGAEESFSLLVAGLDRTRYFPIVVLPSRSAVTEKLEAAGVAVIVPGHNPGRFSPFAIAWFDLLLREASVDVVHIDSFPVPGLVVAASRLGIPIVQHVRIFHNARVHESYRFADRIIAISRSIRLDLLRNDFEPSSIVTIHNGLDIETFRPAADREALRDGLGLPRDAFVIAMIARISEQKRQKFLLSALPALRERIPNVLVLFVGEAYPEYTEYLNQLHATVAEQHLEAQVRFWGFEDHIAPVYQSADAVVLCTYAEPFGRVVIEAMAAGVPIIAPDRKGPAEIITHSEDGLLYDPDDAAALVECFCAIHDDAALRSKLIDRGFRRAQGFPVSRYVENVEKLYDDLLARHSFDTEPRP